MSGIGYVEPYEVASIVTVNKMYDRNIFCCQKRMQAKNRLCLTISSGQHSDYEQNICHEYVLSTKCMPKIGYVEPRGPNVHLFGQIENMLFSKQKSNFGN